MQKTEQTGTTKVGYEYKIGINPYLGVRCGYVSIPEIHPLYNKATFDLKVDVHCGVTFCGFMSEKYWIGFDCGHYCDGQDETLIEYQDMKKFKILYGTIKTKEYVLEQIELLAMQLRELGSNNSISADTTKTTQKITEWNIDRRIIL